VLTQLCDVNRRPTIGWVNGLFLRERTKTSRNVTISFSQSRERATATRGRVQLVFIKMFHETSKSTALSDIKRIVVKPGASNCKLSVKLLLLFCKQSYEHAQRQRVLSRSFFISIRTR
jgi:hypothetical protein